MHDFGPTTHARYRRAAEYSLGRDDHCKDHSIGCGILCGLGQTSAKSST